MASSNSEILKILTGKISHIFPFNKHSTDWFHNFEKLHDLYISEFRLKMEEGSRTSAGILSYLEEISANVEKVLDIPCGIGRISKDLLSRGMDVTGVDISKHFLDEFRHISGRLGNSGKLDLVNATFKEFMPPVAGEKYDLMINWWTSFGYSSYQDDVEFFRNLKQLSHGNTVLMVETWHRDYIAGHKMRFTYKDLGRISVVNENLFQDNCSSVYTTHSYYEKSGNDLKFRDRFDSSIRLYSKDQLLDLMKEAGWEVIDIFNNIETRQPFNYANDRIVLILKPAGSQS